MLEQSATHTASRRLLCLEDDPFVQHAVRRALADFDVLVIESIAAARALIANERFSGWLLDINVADGSGLDLLAWARERGDQTPALVMTGLLDREPVNVAQSLGAEFLYKPYSATNLRSFAARSVAAQSEPDPRAQRVEELIVRASLTKREEAIIRALGRGVERPNLAEALGVSENTVKTLVRRLLLKTKHRDLAHVYRDLVNPTSR